MPTENRSSKTEQMVSVPRDEVERLVKLLAYQAHPYPSPHAEFWQGLLDAPAGQHQGEPAEVAQLRKECESYKRHTLNAAITIGQICEALGIDDHSDPDMIVEAAKSMADGLNRIAKECPLGTPGFAIACEVLGELGVQQEGEDPCDHQFTDDGEFLLVCTECGYTEDHDPHWRPMETAPTDGTLVRLLVEFEENSTEDDQQAPTIGHNSYKNTGEDEWQFAGWNWQQDCYTSGQGAPVGWLPLLDTPVPTSKS
ncbi:hypothetical protein [Pseudomonas mohnii]